MLPKFRVWDKHKKQMIEWIDLDLSKDSGEDDITVFEPTGIVRDAFLMPILLQSTGLKDKNGVEIYEGDIVKINNSKGLVEFGRYIDDEYIDYGLDGWLVYKEYNGTRIDTPLTEYVLNPNFDVEIINNKYEAPHLLEGDNK